MSGNNHWWKPRFATKKALEERIRSIAKETPIGASLGDVDKGVMTWVFSHHDQFEQKCGSGFVGIVVCRDDFNNRFFSIERSDGTLEDISWTHALKPRQKTDERKYFLAALREEVKGQIFAFKKSAQPICGICGRRIDGESHVDHVTPFRDLVSFLFGDDIHETVDMGPTASVLRDRGIARQWVQFHARNAELQMAHAECNLKKG
jgi:5-methylcytosine-specific restriction endonuclease McrA